MFSFLKTINYLTIMIHKFVPYQEYNRWGPYKGNGSGEFPLVSSTVASSLLISVLCQSQLLHSPLGHL